MHLQIVRLSFFFKFRHDRFEQRLAKAGTGFHSPLRRAYLFELHPRPVWQLHVQITWMIAVLGHSHASTDHFTVCHLGDMDPCILRRCGRQQLPSKWSQIFRGPQPVHVAMAVGCVTDKDDAGEFAALQSQLPVDAKGRTS